MSDERELIPVRLSHLFRHCAVGAIVRGPRYLVAVSDIREWTDRQGHAGGRPIPYVEQVRATLEIPQELREPPIASERRDGVLDGVAIPAVRFPAWMRCPNPACGYLYYRPWRGQDTDEPRCTQCERHPRLEQVPWVLAHARGYLAEVPWHFLAHRHARNPKQIACGEDRGETYLRLVQVRGGQLQLECRRSDCKAREDVREGTPMGFATTRLQQPWLKSADLVTPEREDDTRSQALLLGVNDVRVHTAETRSAIVIPPESRIRKGSVVDRVYSSSDLRRKVAEARNILARRSALRQAAQELRCEVADIEDALAEIEAGYPLYGEQFTPGRLLEKEHEFLTRPIPDLKDNEDFVTRHRSAEWQALADRSVPGSSAPRLQHVVEHLIAVSRLKEVIVLDGFRRPVPTGGGEVAELVPPDLEGNSTWLPALELYGEGIFFTLHEHMVAAWEQLPAVRKRLAAFRARYVSLGPGSQPELVLTARFLLLHTLAHLLIRQLETAAGYPAASLKERIYHASGPEPMAGILVYVAVPDVVGSLGGLLEQAEPKRFLRLITAAFEHASWCSLDPVCAEHEGQGPNQLNRAACHACALIPEPACSYGNVLLDRGFIKGDPASGLPPFLDFVLEQ